MEDWDEVFRKAEAVCAETGEDTYSYLVNRGGGIIYMFRGRRPIFPDRNYYSTELLLYVKRARGHLMKAFVSGCIERYVRGSFAFAAPGSVASRKKRLWGANKISKIEVIIGRLLKRVRSERTYTMREAETILGLAGAE